MKLRFGVLLAATLAFSPAVWADLVFKDDTG